MTEREALLKIAWLHRDIVNDAGVTVCAECTPTDDDVYMAVDFPCDTRRVCDEVFSGPGVAYTSSDPWPETLPGSTPGVVTEPLDGAGLIAGDTSKVTVSTRGFAPPTV